MKDFVSWELIDECVTDIAFHLKDTGKDFKGVYGIPRGGVILAVLLSHKLDLPYVENIDKGDKWIVYPWETEDSEEIQDYLK
jgi:hypoxanthine phosphoribosyltransferase